MKNKQSVLLGVGIGVGVALVALVIFGVGYVAGSNRMELFPLWGRPARMMGSFAHTRFGHGIVGIIDSIGNDTFVVKERDEGVKTVLVDKETLIRRDNETIEFSSLKKGEQVIVLGDPVENEGAVRAKLVRVITEFRKIK